MAGPWTAPTSSWEEQVSLPSSQWLPLQNSRRPCLTPGPFVRTWWLREAQLPGGHHEYSSNCWTACDWGPRGVSEVAGSWGKKHWHWNNVTVPLTGTLLYKTEDWSYKGGCRPKSCLAALSYSIPGSRTRNQAADTNLYIKKSSSQVTEICSTPVPLSLKYG